MDDVKTGRLIPYLSEMFRYQAWMSMGKVANPMSGKIERDLQVARGMIDLLGELQSRTEGHRSNEESKLLQGILTELRLNYLDEMKKPEVSETKEHPPEESGEAEQAGPGGMDDRVGRSHE